MNKSLPDKWVRKAIHTAINNMVVSGKTIPCYDTRVPSNNTQSDFYVIMSTQTNSVLKLNKCEDFWESSILLDVITSYKGVGNPGSRLLVDDILNNIISLTDNLVLDAASGLDIIFQTENGINDLSSETDTENIFRKLMRIELTIK
tara:strand:- start:914 stop:1351 length:438 start_codon:yes stop_codon:yes gene_type:complete